MSYNWNGPYIAGEPFWLMITRTNSTTYSGAFSYDGVNLIGVGVNTFAMNGTVLVGMAVCVRFSTSVYNTTTFDNVTLPGWTSLPSAPTGDAQVALQWNAASGATSYNLKRSLTNGNRFVTVTNVVGTNVVNISLANGTTYYSVVSAVNGSGESTNSAQARARPISLPPINLVTTLVGNKL